MEDHVTIYNDLIQGSEEWLAARCGLITASEMKLLLTPTFKIAANEKTRSHLYELVGQRITKNVEPHFVTDDMLRGMQDEIDAVDLYSQKINPVDVVGFITRDFGDFVIGYSPDGFVGDDGAIECKSRRQKFQAQTIIEHVATGGASIPADYILQCQTGLLVTGRKWLDFISYCGGMPMIVIRVFPDHEIQQAILEATERAEEKMRDMMRAYETAISSNPRAFPTERKNYEDIIV